MKNKKVIVALFLSLSLFVLTACGLKMSKESLAEDGGTYKVGKEVWKFKKDGEVDIYKTTGEKIDSNIKYTYKIKELDSKYILTLNQDFNQSGEDYKVVLKEEMDISINKKKQNIKNFTGTITKINVTDSSVESSIPETKEVLEKNFSKDELNKQLEGRVGRKVHFEKQEADYLTSLKSKKK